MLTLMRLSLHYFESLTIPRLLYLQTRAVHLLKGRWGRTP